MHAIGFGPRFAVERGARGRAAFDFSGGVLPPGAQFARASAASAYDASGALVSVAADVARFDHDPATHAARGLLLEDAATNLVSHSADWSDAYWSKVGVAAIPASLIESTATGPHLVRQVSGDISYAVGQATTVSVIARERSGSAKRYLLLSLSTTPYFAGPASAIFDLAAGTAVASYATAGLRPAGGGAWLCWLTGVPVGAGSGQQVIARLTTAPDTTTSYTGDGASGLDVGRIQIERGSVATSRIATAAGPATRAADTLTLDWRSHGVPDGTAGVRYIFDDGSTQDVATAVTGGSAVVPALARPWLRGAHTL